MGTRSTMLQPTWRHQAACQGKEAELFFPPGPVEPRDARLAREAVAKRICGTCPVRMMCLEYALAVREPYGIWGGLNEYERRRLLSRQAG
jgi:WhiB family transcriptional regulator, redox-sensing transcriptional regulator